MADPSSARSCDCVFLVLLVEEFLVGDFSWPEDFVDFSTTWTCFLSRASFLTHREAWTAHSSGVF